MKTKLSIIILLLGLLLGACKTEPDSLKYLSEKTPGLEPIDFNIEMIPDTKMIHKGIFSPDLEAFYYTISDKDFQNFDIYYIRKQDGKWSKPQPAPFNSQHNDHGMSFSSDGKTVYFSSTRPVKREGIQATWHIWKSDYINGQWNEPTWIDIPNLRAKSVSHPSITRSGTLYFHASNVDYSDMTIYQSKRTKGVFEAAQKVSIISDTGSCTPFVSPDEKYLLLASIGPQLDLMISFKEIDGKWSKPKKLNEKINTKGQGNPFVTPDNKYLFFTTGDDQEKAWKIKWVAIESELKRQ